MIESLISFSLRNRFLVLLIAAGFFAWGIYSVKVNKIDAIPDLSENQVIGEDGVEGSDQVEITEGLKEGDTVAISGAYLLYSEIILKKGTDPMAGHNH